MNNFHVAFFSFPHFPDVNPTLALVNTFVRRGFRVTYVSSDRFRASIESLGAQFVACPRFINPFDPSTRPQDKERHPAIPLAIDTLSAVTGFYERNRPDLIIYDFLNLAARILAHRWSIPAVQTSPAFAFDSQHVDRQLASPEFREEILTESRDMNLFMKDHGIKEGGMPFNREGLNLFFYPRELQLEGNPADGRCFYAARCAPERPYRPRWRPAGTQGRPVILVATSTGYVQGPDYFRMCIKALEGLQWHVVLAIGDNNNAASFEPLPAHFEIAVGVPQIEILPFVDLLICLGGMITTVEAMYHGVPLLMMSHGHPEPIAYAENNVRAGIGRHLTKAQTNSENIRSAVLQMSNDTALRERVRSMRQVVQRSPGAEETVNHIMEYADSMRRIDHE